MFFLHNINYRDQSSALSTATENRKISDSINDGNKPQQSKSNVDCLKRNLKATPLHRQTHEERDEEGISGRRDDKLGRKAGISRNKEAILGVEEGISGG